jgi:hypothetical protein
MSLSKRSGVSLLELMVSMLAMTIVGAMAMHLLVSGSRSVQRQFSVNTREDRLRTLSRIVEIDLASRFPQPESALLEVGPQKVASGSSEMSLLLHSHILVQQATAAVVVRELFYSLESGFQGDDRIQLTRTVDPDLDPERSSMASTRTVFPLNSGEQLVLSSTTELASSTQSRLRLKWDLLDERYPELVVSREMVIVGRGTE